MVKVTASPANGFDIEPLYFLPARYTQLVAYAMELVPYNAFTGHISCYATIGVWCLQDDNGYEFS